MLEYLHGQLSDKLGDSHVPEPGGPLSDKLGGRKGLVSVPNILNQKYDEIYYKSKINKFQKKNVNTRIIKVFMTGVISQQLVL